MPGVLLAALQDLQKAYMHLATLARTNFYLNVPEESMQLDCVVRAAGKELLSYMKKPKVVPLDPQKAK